LVSLTSPASPREIGIEEADVAAPHYAVWELTLRCDQPCQHCGSRAGAAREDELSERELLEVARSLGRLGCREVALIGGEAYLRRELPVVIAELAGLGIRVVMQTGGRKLTLERAQALREAGLTGLGVSVDGPEAIHDHIRGNAGSYRAAMRALENAGRAGLILAANTTINRLNASSLRSTCATLREKGIQTWQVQLMGPMGNAADRPDWIIEPWRILEIIDTLAEIQRDALLTHQGGVPFNVFANTNIGYFGPHEELLRSRPGGRSVHWQGCQAGIHLIGIESDGTVKACPSLPTGPYAGGNVRELSLEQIWETSERVRFARDRNLDELWGFCKTCYYAPTCRAGCSWTTHTTLGRRGNNPFCYHRASTLKRRGLRERLVPKTAPSGDPYDFGELEIVEERWPDGDEPDGPVGLRRRLPLVS
jgi:radical SAM protein with 4Fe4S-binding SPASM domain